jgi:hypothetical protein
LGLFQRGNGHSGLLVTSLLADSAPTGGETRTAQASGGTSEERGRI